MGEGLRELRVLLMCRLNRRSGHRFPAEKRSPSSDTAIPPYAHELLISLCIQQRMHALIRVLWCFVQTQQEPPQSRPKRSALLAVRQRFEQEKLAEFVLISAPPSLSHGGHV